MLLRKNCWLGTARCSEWHDGFLLEFVAMQQLAGRGRDHVLNRLGRGVRQCCVQSGLEVVDKQTESVDYAKDVELNRASFVGPVG